MLHLHHTKYFIMHNPDDKPSNCFTLQYSQYFSTFTQYMSVSHGYSTMGGIECGGRDRWGEVKKEDSLTLTWLINGLWRCPPIGVNMRSRDCHATDALELRMNAQQKKTSGWVIRLQRVYNFWLLHATLSTVLDYIGLYFPHLYYFWD